MAFISTQGLDAAGSGIPVYTAPCPHYNLSPSPRSLPQPFSAPDALFESFCAGRSKLPFISHRRKASESNDRSPGRPP